MIGASRDTRMAAADQRKVTFAHLRLHLSGAYPSGLPAALHVLENNMCLPDLKRYVDYRS
jgi:hypothetical protein